MEVPPFKNANFRRTGFRKITGGKVGFPRSPSRKKKTLEISKGWIQRIGKFSYPPASSLWSFLGLLKEHFFWGEKRDLELRQQKKHGKFLALKFHCPQKILPLPDFCFLFTKGCGKKNLVCFKNPGCLIYCPEMKVAVSSFFGSRRYLYKLDKLLVYTAQRGLVFFSLGLKKKSILFNFFIRAYGSLGLGWVGNICIMYYIPSPQ